MMANNSYTIPIIGGGIVGCALSREVARRFDNVSLLEKEPSVGAHTSGRNSGVVHSGFNPKPGSLKAKFCVEGNRAVWSYCREHQIPCERVGTYVVARHPSEVQILEELRKRVGIRPQLIRSDGIWSKTWYSRLRLSQPIS